MTAALIAIGFLLLMSAFFSGSETALTAASRPLMHQLESKGNRRAALVNQMLDARDRLIGAILLGNNLVNILASALATSVLIALFGEAGVAYATLAMTLLVLVFAEIMPKTYAIRNADRMALAIAPVVHWLLIILGPFTWVIQKFVGGAFSMVGADEEKDSELTDKTEELRGAIALHANGEELEKDERDMLRSILDLDEVHVDEIMVHRKNVAALDADADNEELVALALESPFTRIPLYRDDPDNIVGVLHVKALLRAVRDRKEGLAALDLTALAADPWFIPDTTSLLDQLKAFRNRREHFAVVVDEYGSLMGIVTLEDILEEIVGDIADEHDVAVKGVKPQPDGAYIVDGDVTIRDLNRDLDWNLPDEEASTVAGLVLHESRRIPEIGQAFLFHGFRFKILRRQRHQITSIRVTPPSPEGESGTQPEARLG